MFFSKYWYFTFSTRNNFLILFKPHSSFFILSLVVKTVQPVNSDRLNTFYQAGIAIVKHENTKEQELKRQTVKMYSSYVRGGLFYKILATDSNHFMKINITSM